ncbi:MraY family glycosyltransferase [Halobacteriovorax sp. ZH5_bin.2]|uniref:MraY family glycosyltransferase n=1 Tax=Halobacteriovorax sp. ZH5_bin.2 TaxID=3157727 RepID=UPI0037235929
MDNYTLLFFFLSSFLVTYFAIPNLIRISKIKAAHTEINERSSHSHLVSSFGGIGIFLGLFFTCLTFSPNQNLTEIKFLLVTQFIIFFLGLKDDIRPVSAKTKIAVQFICSLIIIFAANVRVESFYGVLGINEIPNILSYIFTIFLFISLINAFNLIDGIDWLAGLITISASSFLLLWFFINYQYTEASVTLALIGSTLAFLIYNKSPAKIFMGDTGSLLIGLTITYLIIMFIKLNHETTGLELKLRSATTMAVSLVFIPVLDTLRVFCCRLMERRSPFSPDRNHIHHIIVDKGFSHVTASIILFIINSAVIVISFFLNQITGKVTIPLLFLLSFGILGLFSTSKIRKSH